MYLDPGGLHKTGTSGSGQGNGHVIVHTNNWNLLLDQLNIQVVLNQTSGQLFVGK